MQMKTPSSLLHWLALYRLYLQGFPACERKPFALILFTWKKRLTDIWYFEKDEKFAGLVFTVNKENAVLIDYLAVSPQRRGEGIGSLILAKLKEYYAPTGIFVEIESVYAECENKEERCRRKHFYLENGMEPMQVHIVLFGIEMELLGLNCRLSFEEYYDFYHDLYGKKAAKHVQEAACPAKM